MGNVTKAQRKRKNQMKTAKKAAEMKLFVYSRTVKDYWKSEWKDAVKEMMDQMEITVPDNKSTQKVVSILDVTFRNVPGLIYRPYSNVNFNWIWPQTFEQSPLVEESKSVKNKLGFDCSISTRVRKLLGLENKLPYNLWNQVLGHLHHFFRYTNTSCVPSEHEIISDEKTGFELS